MLEQTRHVLQWLHSDIYLCGCVFGHLCVYVGTSWGVSFFFFFGVLDEITTNAEVLADFINLNSGGHEHDMPSSMGEITLCCG